MMWAGRDENDRDWGGEDAQCGNLKKNTFGITKRGFWRLGNLWINVNVETLRFMFK